MWFGYGMAWFSTSLSIIAGMYFTHSARFLWFLLIPACIHVTTKTVNDDAKSSKEE